ncbi:MAG: site-specific DNA-methyltransferase, partial [Planctomycetota bacterium]
MRNWIIWHYTFGQQTKNKFARAHTHIFYFVTDEKHFTFNDCAVRVPSDRQLIYNDRRANPVGKMPDDVWEGYSRVCGTFKERAGWHPCQMPESLLKRIIAASSNPGDCVLDPFSGSGTTAAAAYQSGRDYVGIEISQTYVENSNRRLACLKEERCDNLFLDGTELDEVKRLWRDMQIPPREIAADRNLLELFTSQFTVRMSNRKQYSTKEMATALESMSG